MDKTEKKRIDFSTIFINLLAIGFLSYIAWMLCAIQHYMKVVAIYALMMPKFISIWRAFSKKGKLTDFEQWVFIVIALICWAIQSSMTGKLARLIFN